MKRPGTILIIVSLFFVVIVGALGYWKLTHQAYNALDLAIYEQVLWNTSHGHFFSSSIQNGNYLGDHVELFLFPLAFIYRIFPNGLFLVILQAIALFGSSVVVFAIGKHFFSEKISLWLGLAFLINPLIWNMALFEFHMLTFAIPLTLLVLLFYLQKKFTAYLISLPFLMLVREDMALVLAGIALIALLQKRSWKWWSAPLMLGFAWFLISSTIIHIANPDGYKFSTYYTWLGSSTSEIIRNVITKPLTFLSSVFSPSNILFVLLLLLFFIGLPILAPIYIAPLLLVLAPIILGRFDPDILLATHYTAPSLPFFVVASIAGLSRGKKFFQKNVTLKPLGVIVVSVVLVFSFVIWGPAKSALFEQTHFYETQNPNSLLSSIDPQASLYASYGTLPLLANREHIYTYHWAALGTKQFSDSPYEAIPEPTEATLDLHDLSLIELNFANTRTETNEYPLTYKRFQSIFSNFTITDRRGWLLLLSAKGQNQTSVLDALVEKNVAIANETQLGPLVIDEPTVEDSVLLKGTILSLPYRIVTPNTDASVAYAFYILFSNGESLEVPVGWDLYPLHSTSAGDSFLQRIPLPENTTMSNVSKIRLVQREGFIKLNGLRSAIPSIIEAPADNYGAL